VPIALITGPANAGKARVVIDAVERHVARGQEPLLVVPTRADAERYRRELVGRGIVLGARVERFDGLIDEVVRRSRTGAGTGRPVLGELARARVLAGIVERATPDGLPASGGMLRAAEAFVAELQVRRVTPRRLSEALGEWAPTHRRAPRTGPRRREWGEGGVGALFEEYHRVLARIGRVDREQRATRALDALRGAPGLWGQTPVLFYGFDDLTRLQLDAIETLGTVVDASVTVSLTYEPGRIAFAGRAATFQALEPLAAEHTRLAARADYYAPSARAALSHLERSLFEPDAERVGAGDAVRLLEGGGERAELELVAGEVRALLDGGTRAEEIAVVLRAPGPAAELIGEIFGAAGVPYALQRRKPFADTGIGRALIGLLRCVPGSDNGARRAEENGTQGSGEADSTAGEAPGLVGDLLAWLRAPGLLERPELADHLEARALRRGASSAAQARALWEERNWPLETIDHLRAAAERGAGTLIDRAERELQWLFDAPRRGQAPLLGSGELDEARALAVGRRALGELRELVRASESRLVPRDAAELARVLARLELVSGELASAETVAVLDPLALRARRVKALFLCGLQEGVFPAPARAQPLLGDEERRALAEASGLRLDRSGDALAAERYLLYAVVSRPEELLVLSWHTAGDDGAPVAPSLFVDDVCDLFDEDLRERRSRRPLGAVDRPASERIGEKSVDRLEPLRDEQLLAALREQVWSASSLEVWRSCPSRWFVERMLRAEDLGPDPEPVARGGLAHAALKDTLEGLERESGSARLTRGRLQLARRLLKEALARHEPDFPLSVAPERRPGLRRRLQADLERYLEHAATHESRLEPRHLELGFGFAREDERGEGSTLPALDIGGGVMLRGRIDRVDVTATDGEEEAVVYDYKGRAAPPVAKWIEEGSFQIALYMRAVEHLLGLRAVGGFYQPLTGADLRARGVLDEDSGVELECVGSDRRERGDMQAVLEEAVAIARTAAAEAGRGELEARPQTCAFRGGCMYPTICRCER
jgi:ATP-dependent helicase/DNAse subunit B